MTNPDWRPDHRYIPGQTARHPEGRFDAIRASAKEAQDLQHCHAMTMGRAFYGDGFYWEAHEVLEAVWLLQPPDCAQRFAVQTLIQLANARLKLRMGKPKAARRLTDIAQRLWAQADHNWFPNDWILREIAAINDQLS